LTIWWARPGGIRFRAFGSSSEMVKRHSRTRYHLYRTYSQSLSLKDQLQAYRSLAITCR